jgi:hypothetical protein
MINFPSFYAVLPKYGTTQAGWFLWVFLGMFGRECGQTPPA